MVGWFIVFSYFLGIELFVWSRFGRWFSFKWLDFWLSRVGLEEFFFCGVRLMFRFRVIVEVEDGVCGGN